MIRTNALLLILILTLTSLTIYLFPWSKMHWGNVVYEQAKTITVTGTASSVVSNEIANFYAGAEATNDDKDAATSEVNRKMEDLLNSLKTFGIPAEDIQTSNMGVYQNQESYYDQDGRQKVRPGQWRVNNSVTIKLRDVERTDELNDLLVSSGLTNVSGPNFMMDDSNSADNQLMSEAVNDAREKAETIAKNQGLSLGKVVSISEFSGSSIFPMARMASEGGGGGPTAPGSSKISASVIVIFELQ